MFDVSRVLWKRGIGSAVVAVVLCGLVLVWYFGASPLVLCALVPGAVILGASRLRAMVAAQEAHLRLLALFYNDLEARRFIQRYDPVCRQKMSAECRRAMQAHLANAYAYAGDTDKALALIADLPMPQGRRKVDAQLLIAGNTCIYRLLAGDVDGARTAHAQMAQLLEQARKERHKISPNYERTYRNNQVSFDLADGRPADVALVREELTARSNTLHKAVCRLQLARIYAAAGKRTEALGVLKEVTGLKGDVIVLKQARALQKQLQAEA